MPEAFSTPNLVALSITSKELARGGGFFAPPTKIVLSNSPTTIGLIQDRREGGGGVEGVKGPGPVNILRHEIFVLRYISAVHFYGKLSALKGHLQEPSTFDDSFHVRDQLIFLIYRNWFYRSESVVGVVWS